MAIDIDSLKADMESIIANANANIQNGKTARSEDVREAIVKLATWLVKVAEVEWAAH